MPEQPQWSERTLDMPPQDPWAEPPTVTAPAVPEAGEPTRPHEPVSPAPQSPFSRGRASVTPRAERRDQTAVHEPTGTGWPEPSAPREQHSISWHLRRLRRGGEWSTAAVLFAFVCWGIWALSGGGDLAVPVMVFVITLLVGVGVFALARLVGRLVLERYLNRPRHTARGAHMVAGLYLTGVGFTFLQQTAWVMDAFNWTKNLFG
ncbi:DNA-directed RNA polymerase II [Actinoplanes sp. NPDC020271]|uniref:DNA-directed RNA polymerase II n=1 Tax=Actinoplanes sp. NPDC020271 TaxID=3363896 RepID=UPI0037BB3B1C